MKREHLLAWAKKKANNPKLEDADDFAFVLDQLEEIVERVGVTSESIGDLSQAFNADTHKDVTLLLSPYRRAKFL